ncbi:DUF4143 domain-containing protein [bacterium]|nr:DUF4143 domain-containing protein [bacterium]
MLSKAFLLAPLEKYSGSKIRQRGSIPKILALDNALISATIGQDFKTTKDNRVLWGRMVENAVGAKLYPIVQELGGKLLYWRDRNDEIDYVIHIGQKLIAIEVKSGAPEKAPASLNLFSRRYKEAKKVIISQPKITEKTEHNKTKEDIKHLTLEDFFSNPAKSIEL